MSLLYAAGVFLLAAQALGIYALVTRKADVIFSLVMVVLLVLAVVMGAVGVYHKIH